MFFMMTRLARLMFLATLWGLQVTVCDLLMPTKPIAWYHAFLITLYAAPWFYAWCLGFIGWKQMLLLSILTSLCNDLFYGPLGNSLGLTSYDLLEWMKWQLGFRGFHIRWTFKFGLFELPVSSILMGCSIYARIAVLTLLLLRTGRRR